MRKSLIARWLTFILLIITFAPTMVLKAETKPRWVSKGVKELNKQRSNDTYSFHVFFQRDQRESRYEYDDYSALRNYIESTYQVPADDVAITRVEANEGEENNYVVSFIKDNQPIEVYAKLVDMYKHFEDFPNGAFEYDIWQLFAISEPNVYPDYDEFILKDKYSIAPLGMSLIPGLGQIYKGQKTKGYVIMGTEAFMIASIVGATIGANKYNRLAYKHPEVFDSYQSKADSYRAWRTFSIIVGGGLYVYNLFDAALSKGARYVEIKRKNSPTAKLSFYPSYVLDTPGVTIGLNF